MHMNGKANAERLIQAELSARGKQLTDAVWKAMDWRAKKLVLMESECGQQAENGLAMEGIKTDNIDTLAPLSSEMKAYLDELIE